MNLKEIQKEVTSLKKDHLELKETVNNEIIIREALLENIECFIDDLEERILKLEKDDADNIRQIRLLSSKFKKDAYAIVAGKNKIKKPKKK